MSGLRQNQRENTVIDSNHVLRGEKTEIETKRAKNAIDLNLVLGGERTVTEQESENCYQFNLVLRGEWTETEPESKKCYRFESGVVDPRLKLSSSQTKIAFFAST